MTENRPVAAVVVQDRSRLARRPGDVQDENLGVDRPVGPPSVPSDPRFSPKPPEASRGGVGSGPTARLDERLQDLGHVGGLLAPPHRRPEARVGAGVCVRARDQDRLGGDPGAARDPLPDPAGLLRRDQAEVGDHEEDPRSLRLGGLERQRPHVKSVVDARGDPVSGSVAHQLHPGEGGDLDLGGSREKTHGALRGAAG